MKEKENKYLIYTDKIKDFTGWGYGAISTSGFCLNELPKIIYESFLKTEAFIDIDVRGAIIHNGLYGWGDTAIDAYLKAIKTRNYIRSLILKVENKKEYIHKTTLRWKIQGKRQASFLFYRISPRAKKYLDTYGFYEDNRGHTDLYLIKVPFTLDENGYPVTYIIDLVDDETKEKMDITALSIYPTTKLKNYYGNYGTLIKHDISPIKHNIPKINNTKNIDRYLSNNMLDNYTEYNYAATYSDNGLIYGLGATPKQAFLAAKNNLNELFKKAKNIKKTKNIPKDYIKELDFHRKKFELVFNIIPLSTNAKKYIKAFGFTNSPEYNDTDEQIESHRYEFRQKAIKIPPVILDNGYPTDTVYDIVDNKSIAILKTLDKITC